MSKKNHLRLVGGDKDIKEPMTVESAFALVEHIIQFHLRIYDGHPNKGEGYDALPTITVQSSNGSGTKLLALTNDIGAIDSLVVNDSGFDYNPNDKPDAELIAHFILKDVSGTFEADNTLTTHVGTVKSFDSDRQQLNTTFENKIKFDLETSRFTDYETKESPIFNPTTDF